MKIREFLEMPYCDEQLIVKQYEPSGESSVAIYSGAVEDTPYWIAEMEFGARGCIGVEGGALVIDVSPPATKRAEKPNQDILDTLSEQEVLIWLAALLYHYNAGTIHDEQFSEDEWQQLFGPMIEYVEKRTGEMLFTEKMGEWYRKNSFRSGAFQNGNNHAPEAANG